RSCFYCGELLTVYAAKNDIENTLKYAIDLKNYARGEFKKDIDDIIEKLKYKMKEKMDIGDELKKQINIIVHQIKMGRD
ncbi:MAG: serine/threonine protein kinase, partial [Candidatus Altiarchaeum hamiconexum]|nr:serine/threonine protein kinase [Candidatus Altarchaeum hamiconexum]